MQRTKPAGLRFSIGLGVVESGKAALEELRRYNAAVQTDIPFNPNIKDGRCTKNLPINKSNWANSGMTYEQYAPGLRYGYDLANNDTYRNKRWSDIEPYARRDWEARNPGTVWDKIKAAENFPRMRRTDGREHRGVLKPRFEQVDRSEEFEALVVQMLPSEPSLRKGAHREDTLESDVVNRQQARRSLKQAIPGIIPFHVHRDQSRLPII